MAAKANRIQDVQTCLNSGALVFYAEEDNWPPLMWAVSNGNEAIARLLIRYGALDQYLYPQQTEEVSVKKDEEEEGPYTKPTNFAKLGRQTPLLWAAYKGHYSLVQLLINLGCSALEYDIHGNNAIHQAAAGGHISILELFINKGIDFEVTNARGHTALDLATDPATKMFISKALNAAKCESCRSKFSFKNIRFFCNSGRKFYCKDCSITTIEYHTWESEEKERLVCRSLEVHETIKAHEKMLQEALDARDFYALGDALMKCENLDVDPKLRKQVEVLQLKLDHEL